jgi:hypothetical protein
MKVAGILVVSLLAVLNGCEPKDVSSAPSQGEPTISPLASVNPDQLWIMVKESGERALDRCERYYRAPADPRYAGDASLCQRWELDVLDWLHVNGHPDVKAQHLRAPSFWTWYAEKGASIDACQETVQKTESRTLRESMDKDQAYKACNPHAFYTHSDTGKGIGDVGLRSPKDRS